MNNEFKVGDVVCLEDKTIFPLYQGKRVVTHTDNYYGIKIAGDVDWWEHNLFTHYTEDTLNQDLGKHYKFSFKGLKIDVYRILEIFQITNPAQQHAIKKLLRAGKSIKPLNQDIDEVILTLERWKAMIQEDNE